MRAVFRPMLPTDRRFIAATWSVHWWRPVEVQLLTRRAWRGAVFGTVAGWIDHDGIAVQNGVLDRPGVNTLVVADADAAAGDADVFGYLVTYEHTDEPLPLVLFLFVKDGARGAGLATQLLKRVGFDPAGPIPYACHTQHATVLREAGKFPHAQWRPELARLMLPREDQDADLAPDPHAQDHADAGRSEGRRPPSRARR